MNARFSRPGGNLKFVHTSLLEIAYEDDGPRDGSVVMSLHGWRARTAYTMAALFPER